jgi:AAA domain/PLD-like domain
VLALPDWRDEVCSALDFWIAGTGGRNRAERQTCVGRARPGNEPGWYAIDLRGTNLDIDQVDSLRLSGERGPDAGPSYPVREAVQDGPVVRVRVAEFVSLADAYLWQNKQPAAYLLRQLREGVAGLGDAGLAHDLAAGRLAPGPRLLRPVAGFTDNQQEAYESCLASGGVRLIWGPPGTGKTMVLSEAISALLATDLRLLLVSATNIAVDNALLGVIAHRRHRSGQLLRVGLPHHPDVLKHPDVCLPDLVRGKLAEVERRQQAIEDRLLDIRRVDDELRRLQEATAGFDPAEYDRAAQLIAEKEAIPGLAEAAAEADATVRRCRQNADMRRAELADAERRAQQFDASRTRYAKIDRVQQELSELAAATDDLSAQALTARHAANQIEADLRGQQDGAFLARIRRRGQSKRLRDALGAQEQQAVSLERRARYASDLFARRRTAGEAQVQKLAAVTEFSRAEIHAADTALALARQAHVQAEAVALQAEADLSVRQKALRATEARHEPTEAQRAMVEDAERYEWPTLAARAGDLRAQVTAAGPERNRLEAEYAAVQERFERLRKDAEGEIIRRAQVIATTLARLRTSKALMDGPYDIVLVDEAGAANLPEILLAVSRANRTAVLLGDFLQLGAITSNEVENAKRPDVQRWLGNNVFGHCGVATALDAQGHQGCTILDAQYRFGPDIMRLANAVAYDGALKPGREARVRADDDPEIVLVDTDRLGDLAVVRSVKQHSGWWPAGALLSRVIADYHQRRGEQVGIITPYGPQVDATLEALRDQEAVTGAVTEVGTAHRFQGREFPVVVFDLVEDEHSRRWMAGASKTGNNYQRDGVRLFTVAVTRAKTRLYLVGSQKRIIAAPRDTPLAHVAAMLRAGQVHTVRATELITPTVMLGAELPELSPFSSDLAEALAEHVQVADIHDERSFYETFSDYLNQARHSIWIWAPWTTPKRVTSLLPVLADAVGRGVRVTLFVRDPGDWLQGRPEHQRYLADLRSALSTVVEVNVMHQKIVVIDEKTVLLGSLNVLSQSWTREVMLVMQGAYFARKLLERERAEDFAAVPRCAACRGTKIDLRRGRKAGEWHWRCYNRECPIRSSGTRQPWTQPVIGRK